MNQEKIKNGFFKRHQRGILIVIGVIVGIPILLATLGPKIAPTISSILLAKTKIRIVLPIEKRGGEPFDLYIGSSSMDGSGAYTKLNKINETTWETIDPQDIGGAKDFDTMMILKASPENLRVPDSAVAKTKITPRLNGGGFQSGVEIVDYWSKDWSDQDIDRTNEELKKSNVKWVYLAPVWDFTSFDPPKIENKESGVIQYSEEQLKKHIGKLKEAGFEVTMWPQLCCATQPSNFLNKSKAWWDQFFTEYKKYTLYHARIAEETGIGVFIMSFPDQTWPDTAGVPADVESRWEDLYNNVRSAYHGKLGLFDYACCGAFDEGIGGASPLFGLNFKFFGKFDLFAISLWNALSKTDNPTQAELDKNVAQALDNKVKYIYDRYKKPIILQTAYRSADGASRGSDKYSVELISENPAWKEYVTVEMEPGGSFKKNDPEVIKKERPIITYDGKEQAMIYEAILKSVASRKWITGVYPFVYHMEDFDFPRHPDYDVRRKPAETIIANWYKAFE